MRLRPLIVGLLAGLCAVAALTGVAAHAEASEPATAATVPPPSVPPTIPGAATASTEPVTDPATGLPVARGPLIVLPAGCVTPSPPVAVFEGTIVAAVSTTARFSVERVLTGDLGANEVGGQTDVQYGEETRFLSIGGTYLVGVGRSATSGTLFSTVREPAPLFGGDAVIGANDSDVACLSVDDPVRTLLPDGTSVDTGVLAPLHGRSASLASAVARPVFIALGVLLALVLFKHLLFATGRAMRDVVDTMPGREHDPGVPVSGRGQPRP